MQQNGQQSKGLLHDAQRTANVFALAARVMATPLEVCLRRRFGSKYFGFQALLSMAVVPMWIVFWPGESNEWLLGFWFLLLFMFAQLDLRACE